MCAELSLDAILTEYEDLWRQAALNNTGHVSAGWIGPAPEWNLRPSWTIEGVGETFCAASIRTRSADAEWGLLTSTPIANQCPECGDRDDRSMGELMTHLNDRHGWTWLQFANKFRALVMPEPIA